MTRRVIGGCVMVIVLGAALPAAAQTPPKPAPSAPMAPAPASTGRFAISAMAGIAAVQNVGAQFGGEFDLRLSPMLDVIAEGAAMQDLVSRRRLTTATQVAAYLSTAQGKTATGVVKAPGSFGGGGVRVVLRDSGMLQMYAVGTVGAAHVAYQPTFTLAGADITRSLATYGVTLGSDVTGEETKMAYGGGFGARIKKAPWFVDVSLRITDIQTEGQATVVTRLNVGFGIWIK